MKGKKSRNLPHPHSHSYISTYTLIFVFDIFIFRQLYLLLKLGFTLNALCYSSQTSCRMRMNFLIFLIKKTHALLAKLQISHGMRTRKTFLLKNNSLSHSPERNMCSTEKLELQKTSTNFKHDLIKLSSVCAWYFCVS